jgi:hypothetical protein
MTKLPFYIKRYTDNRAVVALLGLMMVLEIVFILRLFMPTTFEVIVKNHVFELVVLLALTQVILLLFRLLDRVPGQICKEEHECESLLRNVVRENSRTYKLHVFSCGLGSRINMITSIHNERSSNFAVEVLAQSPEKAIDRDDAARMNGQLQILKRDHPDTPVEIRFFDSPATIRALILSDRDQKPFWGVVSWYRYEKASARVEEKSFKVIGRQNPAIVLDAAGSREHEFLLNHLMKTFKRQWDDYEHTSLLLTRG